MAQMFSVRMMCVLTLISVRLNSGLITSGPRTSGHVMYRRSVGRPCGNAFAYLYHTVSCDLVGKRSNWKAVRRGGHFPLAGSPYKGPDINEDNSHSWSSSWSPALQQYFEWQQQQQQRQQHLRNDLVKPSELRRDQINWLLENWTPIIGRVESHDNYPAERHKRHSEPDPLPGSSAHYRMLHDKCCRTGCDLSNFIGLC